MESTPGNGSRQGASTGTGQATPTAQQGAARGAGGESQGGTQRGGARASSASTGTSAPQPEGRGVAAQRGGQSMARSQGPGGMPGGRAQSPFGMMMQLSREMDRLMDSFFDRSIGGFGMPMGGALGDAGRGMQAPTLWSPQVEVTQRGDSLVVHADLPGLRREDVHLECTDEGLVIHGERRDEQQGGDEKQGTRFTERSYGSFYRLIPLPEGANTEAARASMRDGVLEVTIPVEQRQSRRRIEIQQ